jgi:hypothetical protein
MATNDIVLLDGALAARQGDAPDGLDDAEYFEFFSFEQILKDYELSDDEVLSGQVGGGQEGGVDGLYVFADGVALDEDSEYAEVRKGAELVLFVIQAKRERKFSEVTLQKLEDTLEDLLELGKDRKALEATGLYKEEFLTRVEIFRDAIKALTKKRPQIRIRVAYASKGETGKLSTGVRSRAQRLEKKIEQALAGATANVEFYGARELYELSLRQPAALLELAYQETPQSDGENGYIALVGLRDYFEFLTDNGSLRRYIFEGNVRDWQGWVEVNDAILASLEDRDSPDFWWLNNGVTIVCSQATMMNNKFQLDEPLIVNGLQTSMVLFNYYSARTRKREKRKTRRLLVRVIVTTDDSVRDRVIRSTNNQTPVPAASLRATDQVQRDIESYFLSQGWFYDRRKNYYRNQGRPASRIVAIPYLAQAMMAICLAEPDSARARPSSLIKNEDDYARVFDPALPLSIYMWAAKLQKSIDLFLRSDEAKATAAERTNLKFHLATLVVADALGRRVFAPKQVESLVDNERTEEDFKASLKKLRKAFASYQTRHSQPMDRVAKSRDFVTYLLNRYHPVKKKKKRPKKAAA